MFDLRVPDSMRSIPSRAYVCPDIDDGADMRTCTCCGEPKAETAFSVRKDSGARRTSCRECMAAAAREWNAANKERRNQVRRLRRLKQIAAGRRPE